MAVSKDFIIEPETEITEEELKSDILEDIDDPEDDSDYYEFENERIETELNNDSIKSTYNRTDYTIYINTPYSNIEVSKMPLDGEDPTWSELLDTFYNMLKTAGYSFNTETEAKFNSLIRDPIKIEL
jgi:hypothetical protein